MKTIAELRKLGRKDLLKELSKARKESMKFRFESKIGQLEGVHKLRAAKTYVNHVLTVLNSINEAPAKPKEVKKETAKKKAA